MCGHVGMFGKDLTETMLSAFKDMLYMDGLRGMHATGVATLNNKGEVDMHKSGVCASEFLREAETGKVLKLPRNLRAVMGHNRFATEGALIDENAHPFQHGTVTMAHNGSMRTREGLDGNDLLFDVDSNQMAHTLSRHKPESFLGETNGAYSLVWFDEADGSINFTRNYERPMVIAKVKGKDAWFYASESWMIIAALSRKNRRIEIDYMESTDVQDVFKCLLLGESKTSTLEKVATVVDTYVSAYSRYFNDYQYGNYNRGGYHQGKSKNGNVRDIGSKKSSAGTGNRDALPWGKSRTGNGSVSRTVDKRLEELGYVRNEYIDVLFVEYTCLGRDTAGKQYGVAIGYEETTMQDVVIFGLEKSLGDEVAVCGNFEIPVRCKVTGSGSNAKDGDGNYIVTEGEQYLVCSPRELTDSMTKQALKGLL